MTLLTDLQRLSAAEEFFDYLGVPYDPAVLAVNRLHVLRLVGNWLSQSAPVDGEDEGAVRERFRSELAAAYELLERDGPLSQRLFKVHRDAVKPKATPGQAFVPLSVLSASGSSES